ncbi:MAG: single-stranded DNA-binding protein [Solirubrobacteraceae bacterium]|nr:single-stranded DNA-binding protein [Solirubrobacteraceae bacterium]
MISNTTITGRLVDTPVVRETPTGKQVTNVRVAAKERRLGPDTVRWVEVEQWGDAAARAALHLVRGQHVTATGLETAKSSINSKTGEPQIHWKLVDAEIDYGPKPLAALTDERIAGELLRRQGAEREAEAAA